MTFQLLRDKGIKLYATNRNLAGQGDFASALSVAKGRSGFLEQFRIHMPFLRSIASKLSSGYRFG
ncbi:MAG: hypothetical protein GKR95_14215 [Gammaproteobacteria bacterium]|nr:hypothetical protein [Gammaproteobacteria bacterium]